MLCQTVTRAQGGALPSCVCAPINALGHQCPGAISMLLPTKGSSHASKAWSSTRGIFGWLRGPRWHPSLSTKAASAGCWLEMSLWTCPEYSTGTGCPGEVQEPPPWGSPKAYGAEMGTSSAGVGPEVPPPQPLCGSVLQDCSLCSWGRYTAKDVCPCLCLCLEE